MNRKIALVPRSVWDIHLCAFEQIGKIYTSEWVAEHSNLDRLRQAVLSIQCVLETMDPTLLLASFSLGYPQCIQVPVKAMGAKWLIPQPNEFTCTLACAWMLGITIDSAELLTRPTRLIPWIPNDMGIHADWVRHWMPIGTQVVKHQFKSLKMLKKLMKRYLVGAIGIQMGTVQHWVVADAITLNGDRDHRQIAIRDPATANFLTLTVKWELGLNVIVGSTVQPAYLLGDFTTYTK